MRGRWSPERVALRLAAMQVVDIVVTRVSPKYGDAHLADLGVPPSVRGVLPGIKVATTAGLLLGRRRPRLRSWTGAGLVVYYAAAVTFHVQSRDSLANTAPAALYGAVAAVLV